MRDCHSSLFCQALVPLSMSWCTNEANSMSSSFCHHHLSHCSYPAPRPLPPSCGPSMCWAASPAGSSLSFRIIDNRPARGTEEQNGSANAALSLQLLLAVTATGAENQTYHFVIISNGSRFPSPCPSVSLCSLSFSSASLLCALVSV